MKDKQNTGSQHLILIFVLLFAVSCVPVSRLKYLNDLDDLQEPIKIINQQRLIVPFDRLTVRAMSIDDKTNQLFGTNINNIIENTVDGSGNINFPFIGEINLSGLTLPQASTKLGKALSDYFTDVNVIINFVDNKITLLGQVQAQGVFAYNQEKMNIYEALAMGGGISQFGDRKNVVLIRLEGTKLMHYKLDLSSARIAEKEYFNIRHNDIIIVEPLKSASWYNFNSANLSTIISTLTSFLVLFFYFRQR
jgi:polysaccharide export outer membrane protein